jgi:predicted O-methyltransferase YrrM
LADNVIRHGGVMQNQPPDENAAAAKSFNAILATHARLESLIVPIIRQRIDGLSISIVKNTG